MTFSYELGGALPAFCQKSPCKNGVPFDQVRKDDFGGQIQRVLAIPSKRYVRRQIAFLTRAEVDALLAVPSLNTWSGRRDGRLLPSL
jgi:hypothetical protein